MKLWKLSFGNGFHRQASSYAAHAGTVFQSSVASYLFNGLTALQAQRSQSPGVATWRRFTAQSGRLSFGSLLTKSQRQSATRPRLVGRPSCGGQRRVLRRGKPQRSHPAVAAGAATAWRFVQGRLQLSHRFQAHNKHSGRPMVLNIQFNTQLSFSAFPSVQIGLCLTCCSRGRQPAARLVSP
jgi:hypothetical protein